MTGEVPLNSNDLARLRTEMAADRTLMAWVRTALSMVSFGFTIQKFFQYLYESRPDQKDIPHSARNLTLMLSGLAVLGLVAGVLERRQTMKRLGDPVSGSFWRSLPALSAIAVAAIAGLVFLSALWRGGPL